MNLLEKKARREDLLKKLDAIASSDAEMTAAQVTDSKADVAEVNRLSTEIQLSESINTLRLLNPASAIIAGNPAADRATNRRARFTTETVNALAQHFASRGETIPEAIAAFRDRDGGFKLPKFSKEQIASMMDAALYESGSATGGYAVPLEVEGQIIPLAPPEMGIYSLATVIPTTHTLMFPRKATIGTAAAKAESGSSPVSFTGTDPTIEQFTLGAYMTGHPEDISWELLQDLPAFLAFVQADILLSIAVLKEGLFATGSGSGQPQGLIGNTGTGVTGSADNGSTLITDGLTVQGDLNTIYHANAHFLMNRITSIAIRISQKSANLFDPVWTRVGTQDYFYGYPVTYSASMPVPAAAATPVLFGDFAQGYIIGERGGSGVNVKILDQPKAIQGLVTVLGYQRFDGRIRRSEAIQAITCT
jgi:HK97 family phage major capsid protein